MGTVVDALSFQRPCFGDCHATLSLEQRRKAIEVIYHCDDALRAWGYVPLYDLNGDRLWREAQQKDDPSYRGVAVRFGECIYRRLVGSMLHEVLHALHGDTSKANYGMPFGLPYGVPKGLPEAEEEAYLAPFNRGEAAAFVGVEPLAAARFGLDWPVLTAREYGTYVFRGGNALVQVPAGYRAVAHIDPVHHRPRYLTRARALEAEARAALDLDDCIARFDAAAAEGRLARAVKYPSPERVARIPPTRPGRNDACACGSGKKVKACCGLERQALAEDAAVAVR